MDQATIFQLHGCFQPSFNVQKHPFAIRMLPHRPHQQIMIDTVKEAFDIEWTLKKKRLQFECCNLLIILARPARLERATCGFVAKTPGFPNLLKG
jgi:hypothetical protein